MSINLPMMLAAVGEIHKVRTPDNATKVLLISQKTEDHLRSECWLAPPGWQLEIIDGNVFESMMTFLANGKGTAEADLRQEYSVLVHCEGERDQKIILEELSRHGLQTRALIVDFPKLEQREPKPAPPLPEGDIEIVRSAAVE